MVGLFILFLKKSLIVTGHDEMVRVGHAAELKAKVEKKIIGYWTPDVADITIHFIIQNGIIGTGTTDVEGFASIHYTPHKTGIYNVSYKLTGKKMQFRAGRLFACSGTRPALVVDIDGTISDYPDWKVPFGGGSAPTFPYAAEFLRKIAKSYDIIYLTARDGVFDSVTRAFLQKHKFPVGPVFYNDWSKQLLVKHHASFKYSIIRKLQSAGIFVVAGIGNSAVDIEAYQNAGIDAYIRDSKELTTSQAIVFKDYSDLEHLVQIKDNKYKKQLTQK